MEPPDTSSHLPSLYPRVTKLRKLAENLTFERSQALASMRHLLRGLDHVTRDNETLTDVVIARTRRRQQMEQSIAQKAAAIVASAETRKRVTHELRQFARTKRVPVAGNLEELRVDFETTCRELSEISDQRALIISEHQRLDERLVPLISMRLLVQHLFDINIGFSARVWAFQKHVMSVAPILSHTGRLTLEVIKRQLLRGDTLRVKLFKVELHRGKIDKLSTLMHRFSRNVREFDCRIGESLARSSDTEVSASDQSDSSIVRAPSCLGVNPRQNFLMRCNSTRFLSESDVSTGSGMGERPASRTEVSVEREKRPELDLVLPPLLENAEYLAAYPDIVPESVRIKRHRRALPVHRRRNRVVYEEEVLPDGEICLVRKPIEYEIVDGFRLPRPYEYFELDGKFVRRPKEYILIEDENEFGRPFVLRNIKRYLIQETADKRFMRKNLTEDDYDYDEIEDHVERHRVKYHENEEITEDGQV
jgi:hypothetical protein